MAWLGTWAKRRKITIDNTNIDSNLTHFPVPIVLGTSVGPSSQDVSDIFDELGSSSLKIAITKADGETQIYGEIEHWDDTNEKAVIWVSKSDLVLSSSGTTDLYLYYDSAQSDNTTYIGDTGDTPAQSVWDADFKAVYHMANATTSTILDSTGNAHDGTKGAAGHPTEVSADIGLGQDFNALDEKITVPDHADLDFAGAFTMEALAKPTDITDNNRVIYRYDGASGDGYFMGENGSSEWQFSYYVAGTPNIIASDNAPTLAFTHIVGRRNSSDLFESFVGGVLQTQTGTLSGGIDSSGDLLFGIDVSDAAEFDGIIAEVRLTNGYRSNAWVKATHYGFEDALLTFSAAETGVQIPTAQMTMAASLDDPVTGVFVAVPTVQMTMAASLDDPITNTVSLMPTAQMTMVARVGIKETAQIPTAQMTMAADVAGVKLQIAIPTAQMTMAASLGDVLIFDHARADVYYIFTLTGAADSLADIEMAMTSFQTRMRNGGPTFLSVVIPDSTQAAAITARPNGALKIDMAYKLQGVFIQRETIVQADFESIRIDEGATSSPITLSGHKTETYPGAILTLATSTYRNIIDGKITHRLAEPNISLRPGDTVTIGSDTFVVDLITYFISVKSKTMEISGE